MSQSGAPISLSVNPTPSKKGSFAVDLFIETNINTGTDGGLYAELINNRAFQVPGKGASGSTPGQGTLAHWSQVGSSTSLKLTKSNPLSSALPKSVVVTSSDASQSCGLSNAGFFGFPIAKQQYDLTFFARSVNGQAESKSVKVGLYSDDGTAYAETETTLDLTGEWKKFSATLNGNQQADGSSSSFRIATSGDCGDGLQLNLISLFPPTWKNTVARPDLAQALADTKPNLVRIPGGNDLEGNTLGDWFNWTNAVGPLENRPGRIGTWTSWNTEGLGLLELVSSKGERTLNRELCADSFLFLLFLGKDGPR